MACLEKSCIFFSFGLKTFSNTTISRGILYSQDLLLDSILKMIFDQKLSTVVCRNSGHFFVFTFLTNVKTFGTKLNEPYTRMSPNFGNVRIFWTLL